MSRRRRGRQERGGATVFVLGLAVVLFAMAGLVVDGGLAVNARQRVADDTEQAARAGAQHLSEESLRRDGAVAIDPSAAAVAARDHLLARDYPAGRIRVGVQGNVVTVAAAREVPTALLSLVGVNAFTVRAEARARAAAGIRREVP